MNKTIILTALATFALSLSAQVKPGVEVLRDRNFEGLKGKRVGLITNPTGVDNNLKSTIDILFEAPGVKLTGLYSPEQIRLTLLSTRLPVFLCTPSMARLSNRLPKC